MNLFTGILTDWSRYEIILLSITIIILTSMGCIFGWYFIKDRRSVIFSLLSSVVTMLLVIATVTITKVFIPKVTESYAYIFLLTTTFSALNVMTLNNYFNENKDRKNLDIDFVTREHFNDSLKLVSIICLFFSALIAFFTEDLRNIVIASGISSVLSIVVNHVFARIIFRDRDGK